MFHVLIRCRTEDREDVPKPSEKWETLVKSRQYCGLITRKDSVYKDCMKHFGSDKIHVSMFVYQLFVKMYR